MSSMIFFIKKSGGILFGIMTSCDVRFKKKNEHDFFFFFQINKKDKL